MRAGAADRFIDTYVADRLLLKLASRCNLTCDYCYWFKDPAVLAAPARLTAEAEGNFLRRLEDHLVAHQLKSFSISLHGGEPLLVGKHRFSSLCHRLKSIECRTGVRIDISCQTNGVLLDEQWIQLFKIYGVNVGVSLDGPRILHDKYRRDGRGSGSFSRVIDGIRLLQDNELAPGVLAVWSPESDAKEISDFFVGDLGIKWFDVLMPDLTHDDPTVDVGDFYIELFDDWFFNLHSKGVVVRSAANFARVLLGLHSLSESLGTAPTTTFSVGTGGELEVLDVLNIVGPEFARTGLNLKNRAIQDIVGAEKWQFQVSASTSLPEKCRACVFKDSCGGGYLPSRYSAARGFDNPSVHCASLVRIFSHVGEVLASEANRLRQRVGIRASLPSEHR